MLLLWSERFFLEMSSKLHQADPIIEFPLAPYLGGVQPSFPPAHIKEK